MLTGTSPSGRTRLAMAYGQGAAVSCGGAGVAAGAVGGGKRNVWANDLMIFIVFSLDFPWIFRSC